MKLPIPVNQPRESAFTEISGKFRGASRIMVLKIDFTWRPVIEIIENDFKKALGQWEREARQPPIPDDARRSLSNFHHTTNTSDAYALRDGNGAPTQGD